MQNSSCPLVSIVIPVYNGTNYMREAIDSALGQTYPSCEVIVVNDGSTDNGATERVALSYGDKIRYYHKENGGVATAINLGIQEMKGEYFAWLSHDDVFYPDKIALQMEEIARRGTEKAIVFGNFDFLDMDTMQKSSVDLMNTYGREQLENGCFSPVFLAIHGSTVLIHRSHFDRVGVYDTKLLATQDSEFLFRVMRGQKPIYVRKPLIIGRLHREQGQRTMACHKEEYNQMFKHFCEALSVEEKAALCGSELNFYYRLRLLLKTCEPAGWILDDLKERIIALLPAAESAEKHSGNIWKPLLKEDIPDMVKVYLFGAGNYGGRMLDELRSYGIAVSGFVDNAPAKQGTLIYGLPCESPEVLRDRKDDCVVIISMFSRTAEAAEQLASLGVGNILTYSQVMGELFSLFPKHFVLD